jgi:SAM-dependent methyltransferase
VTEPSRARRATSFDLDPDAYERGRPGYPADAVRACLPPDARRAVDVGAGTGKLTRTLLALGLEVVAVEPLDGMRSRIPPEATALAGSAEALPVEDASADAVLVGQAFHWFDRPRAMAEFRRVLRPGGTLGVLWNMLDDRIPWVSALGDTFRAEDRATRRDHDPPWSGVPGFEDPVATLVAHEQPTDLERLVDNVASRSVVLLAEPPARAEILDRVRAIAPAGVSALPYVCVAWRGRATS